MQTHQIHISNGRARVQEIRRELFAFPEVLEVFVTSRPDALVVVCAGRPRPGAWLRALRSVGYEPRARRRAGAGVEVVTVVPTTGRAPDMTRLRPTA